MPKDDEPYPNQGEPSPGQATPAMPPSAPGLPGPGPSLPEDFWKESWVGTGAARWRWSPASSSSASPGTGKGEASSAPGFTPPSSATANQEEPPAGQDPSGTPEVPSVSSDFWNQNWVGAGAGRWRWSTSPSIPTASERRDRIPGSYGEAVTIGRGSAEAQEADICALVKSIPKALHKFLNDFVKVGEKCAYYKSQIGSLIDRGCSTLTVDFRDLLRDKKDRELAFAICNYQSRNADALKKAVTEFFKENNLHAVDPCIEFSHLPTRGYTGQDFLDSSARAVSMIALGNEKMEIVVATRHGRRSAQVIVCGVVKELILGRTWNGELTLDDMLILQYGESFRLWITRPSVMGAARKADLESVWTSICPYYKLAGKFALYFEELNDNLMKAKEAEINSAWFYTYICYHPAFLSPTARSNFICRVQLAYNNFKESVKAYSMFDDQPPYLGNVRDDWRHTAKSDVFLKEVYYHPLKKQQQPGKMMSEQEMDNQDLREDIFGALLDFYRNCLTHVKGTFLADLDELEIYTSSFYPWFMPRLLKKLLQKDLMVGTLSGAWSNYKAARSD